MTALTDGSSTASSAPALHRTESGSDAATRWGRPREVNLLGPVRDSGLASTPYLVRRGDGQVIQVSQLVHLVLLRIDPLRTTEEMARSISLAYGRTLTAEGLEYLLRTKLLPLGLVAEVGAPAPPRQTRTGRPLLTLGLRGTLLPASVVRPLARLLAPAFHPVVVVAALAALVVVDVSLLGGGGFGPALESVLMTPTLLLALVALSTLGAVFHELGHAAGCTYSGALPGRIGVGVYLLFPAFFTNVTDSYRLDRAGRLRTDLGGLYFNVWGVLVAGAVYHVTGNGLFLLLIVLMHVEMVQQLLPTVRFDGYFVLTDLTGIPDLFSRIRPVMRSLLPGRPTDPRVADMRPGARRVVTAWVLVVVPLLGFGFGWLLVHLPDIVETTTASARAQWSSLVEGWQTGSTVAIALASVSLFLLCLPLAGLGLVLYRIVLLLVGAVGRRLARDTRMTRMSTIDQPSTPAPNPTDPVHGHVDRNGDHAPGAARPKAPGAARPEPARPQDVVRRQEGPPAGPPAGPADEQHERPDARAFLEKRLRAQSEGRTPASPPPAPPKDPAPGSAAEFAPPLTADAFTDETFFGNPKTVARTGWRRVANAATGGRLALGPSADERRRDAIAARVRAPIDGTRRIVVMSRKGGVGKTTVTVALGATFAERRGDRVVAVDANPDAGNLARRIAGDCPRTITDLLAHADEITTFSAMRRYTSQCDQSRLEVLASDDDASISQALDRPAYRRVVSLLDHYYNLVLLDTGTGILDSANQGLLAEADQLVLVLRAALDGARAGSQTLDWLDAHGYNDLVSSAVVVINAVTHPADPAVVAITDHFARRCAHVSQIPWDPALEAGGRTLLSRLSPQTQESFVDVAAAVADRFSVTAV